MKLAKVIFVSGSLAVITLLAVVWFSAEPVPGDRTPIFAEFVSGMSSKEARDVAVAAGAAWEIRTTNPEMYHPRAVATATGFDHLGFKGRLELTFIGDMLVAAKFLPEDSSSYLDALGRSLQVTLAPGAAHDLRRDVYVQVAQSGEWVEFVNERLIGALTSV